MIFRRTQSGLFILLLLVIISCENPFSTREAEPPSENSTFFPPTIPENVFENLEFAVGERNVENYMRSFVDTTRSQLRFLFVPDQGVAANNPGLFPNWNLDDERRYITKTLQSALPDSVFSLRFIQQTSDVLQNSATFVHDYEVIIRHSRTENIAVEYRGQSKFFLEKNETGSWAIYRWEDYANDKDASWTQLKASFR